jgi:hypothetical protein
MRVASTSTKRKIVAGLGGATYLLWALGWLWICLLYIELFFKTPIGKIIKPDTLPAESTDPYVSSPGGFVLPDSVLIPIAIVGGTAIVVGVLYTIFKVYIPDVQRVAESTVQKTADATTKRITANHNLPAKKRAILTERITFWLKVMLSLLPVVVVYAVHGSTSMMPRELAQAGALVLAMAALLFVLLQHLLIHYWQLYDKIKSPSPTR